MKSSLEIKSASEYIFRDPGSFHMVTHHSALSGRTQATFCMKPAEEEKE
jgi:hypothetical protein